MSQTNPHFVRNKFFFDGRFLYRLSFSLIAASIRSRTSREVDVGVEVGKTTGADVGSGVGCL